MRIPESLGGVWAPSPHHSGNTPRQPSWPSRGVLHTTETDPGTWSGVRNNLRYPYHALIEVRARKAYQLVDLDRTASSLKASPRTETNHAGRHCVQYSLVMRANDTPDLTDGDLQYLADLCGWTSEQCGINADLWAKTHGPNDGIVLATASSPIRMSITQWQTWNGWACHQHIPDNDHWDCGALAVGTIRKMIATPQGEDDMLTVDMIRTGHIAAGADDFAVEALQELGFRPGARGLQLEEAVKRAKAQWFPGGSDQDGVIRAVFWRRMIAELTGACPEAVHTTIPPADCAACEAALADARGIVATQRQAIQSATGDLESALRKLG
jgi:hypothetical protein